MYFPKSDQEDINTHSYIPPNTFPFNASVREDVIFNNYFAYLSWQ